MTSIEKIQKLYPESTQHIMVQAYKPNNSGWQNLYHYMQKAPTVEAVDSLYRHGVKTIAVKFLDEYGEEHTADYSIKELLGL